MLDAIPLKLWSKFAAADGSQTRLGGEVLATLFDVLDLALR